MRDFLTMEILITEYTIIQNTSTDRSFRYQSIASKPNMQFRIQNSINPLAFRYVVFVLNWIATQFLSETKQKPHSRQNSLFSIITLFDVPNEKKTQTIHIHYVSMKKQMHPTADNAARATRTNVLKLRRCTCCTRPELNKLTPTCNKL